MARISNYADLNMEHIRPQFIGRPVDAIKETNQVLDQRYRANKSAYEEQVNFLENTDVEEHNQQHVNNRKQLTEDMFKAAIEANDFEHADSTVFSAAKGINSDKYLKGSIMSKMSRDSYMAGLDEMVKNDELDVNTVNQIKTEASNSNYQTIEVDENGVIENMFSGNAAVKDPDINGQVMEYANMLKASSKPLTTKDGRTMFWAGEGYKYTGQTESIPEQEAIANITAMLMDEPQNRAYYQQQQRLNDADMVVRNDDGTYKLNEKGNPIYDINQVDQRAKVASLGIDPEQYLIDYANNDGTNSTDLSAYSQERQNELLNDLYNSNYMYSNITKQAQAGVGIVDYEKVEYKYHKDDFALARLKRKWQKEDEEALKASNPRYQMRVTPEQQISFTPGEYSKYVGDMRNNLKTAQGNLESAAVAAGVLKDGESIDVRKVNGVDMVGIVGKDAHGRETFINVNDADRNGIVSQKFVDEYKDNKVRYELAQADFDATMEGVPQAEQDMYRSKAIHNLINEFNLEDLSNIQRYIPSDLLKDILGDAGLMPESAGQTLSDAGLAKRNTDIASRLATWLMPGATGYMGDSWEIPAGTNLDELQKVLEDAGYGEKLSNHMADSYSEMDPARLERFEQIAKSQYDTLASVYNIIPISGSTSPGAKALLPAAMGQVTQNYRSAVTPQGVKAFETEESIPDADLIQAAVDAGTVTVGWSGDGGKDQLAVYGKYKDADGNPHGVSFLVDSPPGFGNSLQTEPEQIHTSMTRQFKDINESQPMFQTVTVDAGVSVAEGDGVSRVNLPIRTTKVPLDARGNILPNQPGYKSNQAGWTYLVEVQTANGTQRYTSNTVSNIVNSAAQFNWDLRNQYGLVKQHTKAPKVIYPHQLTPYGTEQNY